MVAMSDAKIDNELLLRIAEGLETAGASYRDVKDDITAMRQDITAMRGELFTNTASVKSAHARLKGIETALNGEGQDKGIRVRLELIDNDLAALKDSVSAINDWRNNLSEKKIDELKSDTKTSRASHGQLWLTVAALAIAAASMIGSCGPQIMKAWAPSSAMAKETGK